MFVIHGVTLPNNVNKDPVQVSNDLPISHGKTHGVTDQDDGDNRVRADLRV